MPPTRRPQKRSSTPTHKIAPAKKRRKRAPAPIKRKGAKKQAPKKQKRSAPKKQKRSAPKKRVPKKAKRSAAAKKGWIKRRKKQRMLDAMADARMKARESDALPPGWIEHRKQLRLHEGKIWRAIEHEFDQREYDAVRLETLEELEIDFATKDDLDDYLRWLASELEIDISDMYRMYLGYGVGVQAD